MANRLVFFTSLNGSLLRWRADCILNREILHLKTYVEHGLFDEVYIFSYNAGDASVLDSFRLQDSTYQAVHLLVPTHPLFRIRLLGPLLYSLLGPLLHRREIRKAAILKTNQISGSWAALVAKLVTGRPLLLRFGYILSRRHAMNGKPLAAFVSRLVERAGFRRADAIVVTSELAREEVGQRSGAPGKVHLVPTYVDVSVFDKKTDYDFDTPALYVGRFTPQKNLLALLDACAKANFALHLVGAGDQEAELKAASARLGVPVRFLGRIPNTELAAIMRGYTYFVLPSLHEGLPKALLEAMASGLICIGTDIPGTADIIRDGETGYLASTPSPDCLANALTRARQERNSALGENARAFIEARFGLGRYIAAEGAIISTALNGG